MVGDALDFRQAVQTDAHGQHHADRVCLARAHSAGVHAGQRPAVLDRDLPGWPSRRHARAGWSAPPLRQFVTWRPLRIWQRLQRRAGPAPAAAERFLIHPAAARRRVRVDRASCTRRSSPAAPSTPGSAELTSIGWLRAALIIARAANGVRWTCGLQGYSRETSR